MDGVILARERAEKMGELGLVRRSRLSICRAVSSPTGSSPWGSRPPVCRTHLPARPLFQKRYDSRDTAGRDISTEGGFSADAPEG
jgi:hypothetical protein